MKFPLGPDTGPDASVFPLCFALFHFGQMAKNITYLCNLPIIDVYSSLAALRCILFTLEMFSEQYKNKHANCSQIADY